MTASHNVSITSVRAVNVRDVPFSCGLITPWDPSTPIYTRDYCVVRIETSDGHWAISMDGEYSPHLPVTAQQVEQLVAPRLVGQPLLASEAHAALLRQLRPHGRFFFVGVALWDLIGQALGTPLYRLWGSARASVPVYASTVHHARTAEQRAEDCLAYLERGYRAVKLRLSGETIADDVHLVETCRHAVGDRMAIMVDANQSQKLPGVPNPGVTWDLDRALATAHELAALDVAWLEEPLAYALPREGHTLREQARLPIAGGEALTGLRAYRDLLHSGVYDIVQPDPITGGSPMEMLKIAALCEADELPFVFHHGKSGVGFMIGLHLSCATRHSPWLEHMDDGPFWQARGFQVGFRQPVPIQPDGTVRCPDAPGLGIDWDPAWLERIGLA